VEGADFALWRLFETGTERRSPRSNGLGKFFGAEAKRQAGSVDLAMVAKASLRASERPFRVSGSGEMFNPLRVCEPHRPGAVEKQRWRAVSRNSGASGRRSNAEHAGGSLNRTVNPGRDYLKSIKTDAGTQHVSSGAQWFQSGVK
jgi:hypothetical protein